MTNYDAGRRDEWKVRDNLRAEGYEVVRVAGSKGAADLIAFKDRTKRWRPPIDGQPAVEYVMLQPHDLLFVQVKRGNGTIPPAERHELLRLAAIARAAPLVAVTTPRKPITYRRLTGPGPKDWAPWTADWAVTA